MVKGYLVRMGTLYNIIIFKFIFGKIINAVIATHKGIALKYS